MHVLKCSDDINDVVTQGVDEGPEGAGVKEVSVYVAGRYMGVYEAHLTSFGGRSSPVAVCHPHRYASVLPYRWPRASKVLDEY